MTSYSGGKGQLDVRRSGLVRTRGADKGITAEITVPARPERVWRVLTSFEEMPVHLSAVKKSRLIGQEGNHRLIEQTGKVDIPVMPLSFRVALDVVEERPFLYFSQRWGSFTTFSGYWRVDPCPEGRGSRVRYCLHVDMPHGLRKLAAEHHLRRMVRQNLQELAAWIQKAANGKHGLGDTQEC
ncbi:MAG: SRPBCC family protein [Syntrophobacteria bacterium]